MSQDLESLSACDLRPRNCPSQKEASCAFLLKDCSKAHNCHQLGDRFGVGRSQDQEHQLLD